MILLPTNLRPSIGTPLLRLIKELEKIPFSFDDIIGYIERQRQKELRIEEDKMPAGMTGYAVALLDCDLICTRPGLSPTQKRAAKLHEMSHFIRGDIALFSNGKKTPMYKRFIYLRDRYSIVESRQRFFDMYTSPKEKDTEELARILLQYIIKHESLTPTIACDLYTD